MNFFRLFIYCVLLSIPSLGLQAQQETPTQLLDRVQASLVEIKTSQNTHGLGIIIDSHGIIVTNTSTVANADHIYVGLPDGQPLEAKLIYSSGADFSFIQIEPPYPLETITWADSSQAQTGTPVLALTLADDNQEHIMGGGITDVTIDTSTQLPTLYKIDINFKPDDSGGPLLDPQGRLLDMVTDKQSSDDGKTYAIASNKIRQEYQLYKDKASAVVP